jgi:hypothetical protein
MVQDDRDNKAFFVGQKASQNPGGLFLRGSWLKGVHFGGCLRPKTPEKYQ